MARLIPGDETAAQLCRSFGMSGELGRSTGREHVVDYGVLGSLVRAMGKTTRLETSDAASLRRQTALSLVSSIAFGARRCDMRAVWVMNETSVPIPRQTHEVPGQADRPQSCGDAPEVVLCALWPGC